jgi:hypothetical protein
MTPDPSSIFDKIKAILGMAHLHAAARLSLIHAALGVPKNKRGRKPSGQPPKAFDAEYQRNRRLKLKAMNRCTKCSQPNDRPGKSYCAACAAKNSPKRFHA